MAPRRDDPHLKQLADRLILRHLRVSIPEPGRRSQLQHDRRPEPLLEQRVRCIAVVGAGASAPLLDRGDRLADELEDNYPGDKAARETELSRLKRVYGLDEAKFETRLAALSRNPAVANEIRQEIAKRYSVRHPTILGYELLAHLLKHRFLDAIISFNFDELLDQSLDDELGRDEYRRLVSDRDVVGCVCDPDDASYLPLYLKLHGTATEPDSLRFTREAYYELPQKLAGVVESLLRGDLAVIVNVGSAMSGYDLHRVLRIPERLEVYDLSYRPLSQSVRKAIQDERTNAQPDSIQPGEPRTQAVFAVPSGRPPKDSDEWVSELVNQIRRRSGNRASRNHLASVVEFRSVKRHGAVAELLGPAKTLSGWIQDPVKHRGDYVDYLRKRTVIELAFSGAKARGLAQLSWLAVDRCGAYYELYCREARQAGIAPQKWADLRAAAGLDEHDALPDVVQATPGLCGAIVEDGRWKLREFKANKLARHVLTQLGNNQAAARRTLTQALEDLQNQSEVEILPTDDRICSKAFTRPLTLPTVTSLRLFTLGLFEGIAPDDHIYISCETGEWLIDDQAMYDILSKQNHVAVLTAFDLKYGDLDSCYSGRISHKAIDPWRHNRHMTIVCNGATPVRAVYFARPHRTPLITPVYVSEAQDAQRLKRAYDLMCAGGPPAPGAPAC